MNEGLPVNGSRQEDADQESARRAFLKRCGRFAAVTPPAMTMLLAVASTPTEARASTIGWKSGGRGYTVGGNSQGQNQGGNSQGGGGNSQQ